MRVENANRRGKLLFSEHNKSFIETVVLRWIIYLFTKDKML